MNVLIKEYVGYILAAVGAIIGISLLILALPHIKEIIAVTIKSAIG